MALASTDVPVPPLGSSDGGPLYRRLLNRLRDEIHSGRLQPGDAIPPEVEIARRHGISRHTARQAIMELAREGLIRRQRGRGTFVAHQPLVQSLSSFYSFAHEMRVLGLPHHTRVLHRALIRASPSTAEQLRLADGAPVIEMELLRLVEGEPVALDFSLTPYESVPALLGADITQQSLYDLMAELHGLRVTSAHEQLRPVVLDGRQASMLRVSPGSPAFHVDRRTMVGETPIEWRRSLVRGDRYLFRVDLPVR